MLSNYPDGHPTGSTFSTASTDCPNCGESMTIHHEYERDTNAHIVDDAFCDSCKHEFTDKELDNLDWESGYDEPDWDAMRDAQMERAEMEDEDDPYEEYPH